jgi:hypothetical protein
MKRLWIFMAVFFLAAGLTGCAHKLNSLPVHDEVLTYDLPYDVTFLRVMESIGKVPDWVLESTDKEKGTLSARNLNFFRFDDSDKHAVTFEIKRLGRSKTSVQLVKESQQVPEGDKLMKAIDESLSHEALRRQKIMGTSQ